MNRIRSMAAREFRAFFNSPIAYVFLLAFVGASLFTFFNVNAFFARGQADMRGLFESVPFLTVLLVPALTMRLWAEEEKQGTIEMLLTLPARDYELVTGKFLASWGLLAVFWKQLAHVPAIEQLAHRVTWAAVVFAGLTIARGEGAALRRHRKHGHTE